MLQAINDRWKGMSANSMIGSCAIPVCKKSNNAVEQLLTTTSSQRPPFYSGPYFRPSWEIFQSRG